MPNDPETVKLLQQILEELQKNREYRKQMARGLLSFRPDSTEEHERRMRELDEMQKEAKRQRQEDLVYRNQLLSILDRLIEVISAVSTKLDRQG